MNYNELIIENIKRIRDIQDEKELFKEYNAFLVVTNSWPKKYQFFFMWTAIRQLKGNIYNAPTTIKWFEENSKWLWPNSEENIYRSEYKNIKEFEF